MKIAMLFAVINPALDPRIHIYASAEFRAGFRRLCRCFPENIVGVAHTGTNVQCRKRHSASMAQTSSCSKLVLSYWLFLKH